jgi:hypothetical protein
VRGLAHILQLPAPPMSPVVRTPSIVRLKWLVGHRARPDLSASPFGGQKNSPSSTAISPLFTS